MTVQLKRLRSKKSIPNNQNAIKTEVSAPWNIALNLARYIGHEEAGDPGSGNAMPVDEGDLFIAVRGGWKE